MDAAMHRLQEILGKNKEYIPALVMLALAKFISKKNTDARNYLKTVMKHDY